MSPVEAQSLDFATLAWTYGVRRHAEKTAELREESLWGARLTELQSTISMAIIDGTGSDTLPNVLSSEYRLKREQLVRDHNDKQWIEWIEACAKAQANDELPPPPPRRVPTPLASPRMAPWLSMLLGAVPGGPQIAQHINTTARTQDELYTQAKKFGGITPEAIAAAKEAAPGKALFEALSDSSYREVSAELDTEFAEEESLAQIELLRAQGLLYDGDVRELLKGDPFKTPEKP